MGATWCRGATRASTDRGADGTIAETAGRKSILSFEIRVQVITRRRACHTDSCASGPLPAESALFISPKWSLVILGKCFDELPAVDVQEVVDILSSAKSAR